MWINGHNVSCNGDSFLFFYHSIFNQGVDLRLRGFRNFTDFEIIHRFLSESSD